MLRHALALWRGPPLAELDLALDGEIHRLEELRLVAFEECFDAELELGLAGELVSSADVSLAPIHAKIDSGYNHLSVRAACAIVLDRLFG